VRFLAILAALVPFAFAAIRAITTGSDLRYLWMALAAVLGVTVVVVLAKPRSRARNEVLARSAGALVLATLLAGSAGYLLGARASYSIWIVAIAFGLCEASAFALASLSRLHANMESA
jgi:hypothetical protein